MRRRPIRPTYATALGLVAVTLRQPSVTSGLILLALLVVGPAAVYGAWRWALDSEPAPAPEPIRVARVRSRLTGRTYSIDASHPDRPIIL